MKEQLNRKNIGRIHIYCDMDGVLARWKENCTYEMTWENEYFLNLELEPAIKEALLILYDAGFDINILSAAYMNGIAEVDKAKWLNMKGLGHINAIFMPCGKNKADYVKTKDVNILLDDYNHNLTLWEDSSTEGTTFVAVKFLNGLNGSSNGWNGRTISKLSSGKIIAKTLIDFANGALPVHSLESGR